MARVLIVDDEPSMRVALKSLFQSNGHETVEATSGSEALAHLDGVDAVITDYSMQHMNGIQLLQAIHERDPSLPVMLLTAHGSERVAAPLVRFNCAAIPGELTEAELFGHTRGAFTGASQARRGFVSQADGGTLVLDEVGELPFGVQAKLLRTLQEGEIQPVGAGRVEKVDVRIVACTNRDLEADAGAGRFRLDLYYRLAVLELLVPPLRERREDIPGLASEFARRYVSRFANPGP